MPHGCKFSFWHQRGRDHITLLPLSWGDRKREPLFSLLHCWVWMPAVIRASCRADLSGFFYAFMKRRQKFTLKHLMPESSLYTALKNTINQNFKGQYVCMIIVECLSRVWTNLYHHCSWTTFQNTPPQPAMHRSDKTHSLQWINDVGLTGYHSQVWAPTIRCCTI